MERRRKGIDAAVGQLSASLVNSVRLVYIVSLFPCWSETFIVREIDQLLKLGAKVSIVSLKPHSESLVHADAAALLPLVTYPVSGAGEALRGLFLQPLPSLRELGRIVAGLWRAPLALGKTLVVWWRTLGLLPTVRGMQPQHIHAHWATYPSTAAMIIARRLALPFSFTAHAHDIFVNDHLLRDKLYAARFAVTISQFNRRFLAERFGADAVASLQVIHCGVTSSDFERGAVGEGPCLLLAVGRLDPIKGFRHLIDACAALRRRDVKFHCVVIGEGPLRSELQRQITRLGVGDSVELMGAQNQHEVRSALQRAAVFVAPATVAESGDRDGIPVALMEAMAAGVPVVSTAVSGIPELIEHECSGLLANAADADDLACCIQRILADSRLATSLAANARRKVEDEFSLSNQVQRLYQHFAASIADSR